MRRRRKRRLTMPNGPSWIERRRESGSVTTTFTFCTGDREVEVTLGAWSLGHLVDHVRASLRESRAELDELENKLRGVDG